LRQCDAMDGRAVAELRELARRDEDLSARADRARALDAQVAALRSRAEAIDAFFGTYPEEETRRREAVDAAQAEVERRCEELADAERELASAPDAEAHERAQSAVDRGRDHVAVAQAALDRAGAAAAELERDAASLPEEVPLLEARARAVADEVDHVPAPSEGVRGLVDWASRVHAELFVAVRQLDAQRERVIREANELASMLLGEPTYGSTVAQLAQRVLPLAAE
jgi:chromosome segregation ATPase